MLSSGGVPNSSSERRSAHSWHQLANSIYFNGISLCQNIHEQEKQDPHTQEAATRARKGAREGKKRTARRSWRTVTKKTRRLFSPSWQRAGGRGHQRICCSCRQLSTSSDRAETLETSEGCRAVTLLTWGEGGGAGAERLAEAKGLGGTPVRPMRKAAM